MIPLLRKLFRISTPAQNCVRRKWNYQPQLEGLEERTVLSAILDLIGSQSLIAGANIDASHSTRTGESEMQVAINPANPLQVVGFTHNVDDLNEMSILRASDGGISSASWRRTVISDVGQDGVANTGDDDGLGHGTRFDPTLQFDADGHLFIAYGFGDGHKTSLVTARSDDGGATFFQFRVPQSNGDVDSIFLSNKFPGLDKWFLTTGLDPTTGGQAVYIAYTHNEFEDFSFNPGLHQTITVIGSNDGGLNYTSPKGIGGGLFANPAVGPNGELYVVWHDLNGGSILLAADLDGLWGQGHDFGGPFSARVVRNLRESFEDKTTPANPKRGFDNGPSIDVNRTLGTPFYGRVYVTWTDTFSGDDTEIFLATSDDHGDTWTLPNAPSSGGGNVDGGDGTDFMATVAVDQSSGSVNVGYYTTTGDVFSGNDDVNFQLASSMDGGTTWTKVNLSSATSRASAMRNGNEFGDYVGLAAYGGTVRGFWTDNRGQTPDTEAFTATASFQSATAANTLVVTGTSAADTIDVSPDPANANYVTVTVNGRNEYSGLWASVNAIDVYGFGGDDTISIQRPPVGVPVIVYGGDGNDAINVVLPSVPAGTNGVQVFGEGGTDSVTLSNDLNPAAFTYTVTGTTVNVSDGSFGGLGYDTVESVILKAGPGNDTFNFLSTASGVGVTVRAGGGNDTANVGTGNLSSILGGVLVDGGSGRDGVNLFDNTSPYAGPYTITNTRVSAPGSFVNGVSYIAVESVILNAATGNNAISIVGKVPGVGFVINAGDGADTLIGTGNTWNITGNNAGTIDGVEFNSVENLTGGAGTDTFVFTSKASAITGHVDGGGGSNWLNYLNYPAAVSVQLPNTSIIGTIGSATGTGGVLKIQNVIGSSTASNTLTGNNDPLGNILVGGDAADTITAGAARSILIGGNGADVLTGGTADDIVIGGFTDYDHNSVALQAIMTEWRNPADDAPTRIGKIRSGIKSGLVTYRLVWADGGTGTVHDDGAADTLRGDPSSAGTTGFDWFFANLDAGTLDTILDLQKYEKVNNQA